MFVRAKITLSVLIAILLGGTGYFFIINKSKQPEVLPPVNEIPKAEEIDTSDWQTSSFEFKGKEDIRLFAQFKYPRSWSIYESESGYYVVENELYQELLENKKTIGDFNFKNFLHIYPGNIEYLDEDLEYRMKYGQRTSNYFFDTFRGFEQLLKKNADFFETEENIIGTGEFIDLIYEDKGYVTIYGQINPIYEEVQKYVPIFLAVVKNLNISINITPQKVINISDWQIYKNEKLGFEIKIPKTFEKRYEIIGPRLNIEDEFWQEQVGTVSFYTPQIDFPQFLIRVKDSDYTMDGFEFRGYPDIIINNLPGSRRRIKFPGGNKFKIYSDFVLIKNGRRYYKIEFLSTANPSKEEIEIWKTILSTFKPLD